MPAQTGAKGEEPPYVHTETIHWKVTRCTPYSGEDISRNIYKRSCWYRYDEKPGCIQRWR